MLGQYQVKGVLFNSISACSTGKMIEASTTRAQSTKVSSLERYAGHQLADLNSASLMDRVDTKFMIPRDQLSFILDELRPYYSALDINGQRIFTYHNTYFDTEDLLFYHMHHQGKLNRYKVRHRYYTDTKTGFLEVKFKNNKGRTIKTRIPCVAPRLNDDENDFLRSKLGCHFRPLKPAQWGSYQRIALANEASGERLTLDLNLTFQSIDKQSEIQLPNLFIAELKQNRYNIHSPFSQLMAKLGVRSNKFSKYCIGSSLIVPELKANRFKQQLMALQNIH